MNRRTALSLAASLLCGTIVGCRRTAKPVQEESTPPLILELLAFDTALEPRRGRPFIAGEAVHLDVRLQGGAPPYEIQVATRTGDPLLAASSATIEASPGAETQAGLEFRLGSEVPSGDYALTIRISDNNGKSASIGSDKFAVIGRDAPLLAPTDSPLELQVVDVAGRARASFFQGEEIVIRAYLDKDAGASKQLAVAIIAEDQRPFMPRQLYPIGSAKVAIPLVVPSLARVGHYRVDLATESSEASVPLVITGRAFPPADKPVLTDLELFGGPNLRIPRAGILTRGEALRVDAIVGGIKTHAQPRLRLRDHIGKQVSALEFPTVAPADPHPAGRLLATGTWTPPETLATGRYMLELEVDELGVVSTLYREILLR